MSLRHERRVGEMDLRKWDNAVAIGDALNAGVLTVGGDANNTGLRVMPEMPHPFGPTKNSFSDLSEPDEIPKRGAKAIPFSAWRGTTSRHRRPGDTGIGRMERGVDHQLSLIDCRRECPADGSEPLP